MTFKVLCYFFTVEMIEIITVTVIVRIMMMVMMMDHREGCKIKGISINPNLVSAWRLHNRHLPFT